jgi:two-component system chemotaxis sensor kinase CheA
VSDALLAVFRDEAAETLARLSRLLLELETQEDDPDRLRELFRLAHSLKGASSTVGRGDLTQVAHELEGALSALRHGQVEVSRRLIDAALGAVDLLTTGLEHELPAEALTRVSTALRTVAHEQTPEAAVRTPDSVRDALLPALNTAREGRNERLALLTLIEELVEHPSYQAHDDLRRLGTTIERALREEGAQLPRARFEALAQAIDVLLVEPSEDMALEARLASEALEQTLTAVAPKPAGPNPIGGPEVETLRVPVTLLDALLYRVDELVATKLRLDHARASVEQLQTSLTRRRGDLGSFGLEIDRRLESVRRALADDVHGLGLLTQALQDEVRDVRMVQIGPLLEPFRRTVRDAANSLGKQVRLVLQGEEVRVDKRLFDLAKEPLTHLLRNAIDHGIEAPQTRVAAGKDEVGTIRVSATSQDSQLLLEVSDDGNGVDVNAVRANAVRAGLLAPEALLTEQAALEMIFQPGFSTSATANTISGRGVGLDVVRVNIARLGGRVEVTTRARHGTRFVLSLPLTLTEAGGLFVRAGRVTWCLPLSAVEEVCVVERDDVGVSQGKHFARLRGNRVAPWARLADVLAGTATASPEQATRCVVLMLGDRRAVLAIEELIGQHEVVVKALAPGTPRLSLVTGATSLADGTLVTVLEPSAVLEALSSTTAEVASARAPSARVLVVDDTLTTRTMVASVLERAGYEVLLAADGEAAWQRLAQEPTVQVLVSDVDMPVLDGLALTRRLRASARWATLPVVLLTSLGSSADRAMGAEAGATAYVVKTDFDPAGFIDIVRGVLREQT